MCSLVATACGGGASTDAAPGDSGADAMRLDAGDAGISCASDAECDDGLFCDGVETCDPSSSLADARGCVPAEMSACAVGQSCDETGRVCATVCAVDPDADGDGYDAVECGGDDCDDSRADVNRGAVEVCDGDVDNDCNGLADAADGVCVPCGVGYRGFDSACSDIDECAEGDPCAAVGATCTNLPGSYTCACPTGYVAAADARTCADVDECTEGAPCGAEGMACTNLPGSYSCSCTSGYDAPASGGACADIDECALGSDDCDADPVATCTNTPGSFSCTCPSGFGGTAHGVAGCELSDASLLDLVPSAGALSPSFAADTLSYQVAVPPGVASLRLTPTVAYPSRATIRVDGVVVTSGTPSAAITPAGFSPVPVRVSVQTEDGSTRSYDVVVSRGSRYLKASNTDANDLFGGGLALSADGSTLAVGAPYEASSVSGVGANQADDSAPKAGAVYVFTRSGASWSQQAYIKASNAQADDTFGAYLALSSDGSTLAVGVPGEDSSATGVGGDQADNSAPGAGAVYVFTRSATSWSQQAYVKASNTGAGDAFGVSVALSAAGGVLAVGALGEASSATGVGGAQVDDSATNAGAVYVFTRSGSTWSQRAYLKAPNTDAGDAFGASVALSDDASTLAVAATGETSPATGIGGDPTGNTGIPSGAVYVFLGSVATWTLQAYIKPSASSDYQQFGFALALSSDGSTLAVGAPTDSSGATGIDGDPTALTASQSGAVYVFRRGGATWSLEAYIKASNTDVDDFFGLSLGLSNDGSSLVVGAAGESSNAIGIGGDQTNNASINSGAVYRFTRSGSTWSQQAYLKASNTGAGDTFGFASAVSGDGTLLICSAPSEGSAATGLGGDQTDDSAPGAGAVYAY